MDALKKNCHIENVNLRNGRQIDVQVCAQSETLSLSPKACANRGLLKFILLVMLWLVCGACFVESRAEEVGSIDVYEQEMSKVLNDSSVCDAQEDVAFNTSECCQPEIKWWRIMLLCAVAPFLFFVYMLVSQFRGSGGQGAKDGLKIVSVSLAMSLVLFFISVVFFYLKFYAQDNVQAAFVGLAFVVVIIVSLKYMRKKK